MTLSKSLYTKGIQCPKALWLKKYKPSVLTPPDESTQAVFETENVVGDLACDLFPYGKEYFALQTRKVELIEQRLLEQERVQARKKLSQTKKELSEVIYEQTGKNENFAFIISKGDKAKDSNINRTYY